MHYRTIVSAVALLTACQSESENPADGFDAGIGGAATGGTLGPGGSANGGRSSGTGGSTSSGGRMSTGGSANTGGDTNTGGTAPSTGGATNTGGTANTGGAANTGGTANTGGAANTGGVPSTGGATNTGGASGDAGPPPCPGAKPDATNTGVPVGTTLTVVNSNVTVTQNGATVDAQDIHGFLFINANDVHVTRCLVRGGVATQNTNGIRVQSGKTGTVIEDTEVAIANPSPYIDAIGGSNMIVRRANVHGGVDGMKVGSNSRIECSYIHDMMSFASDPNQGGGPTHNDAIQILSGTGIYIIGNQLVAAKDQNAAIQITQDFGVVGNVHIENNWSDGGGCTFNIAHKVQASLTDVHVIDNRFGRNSFYGCPILISTQTTLDQSGNVYDDNNAPISIQQHD